MKSVENIQCCRKTITPLEALKQMGCYSLEMGVAVRDLPNYEIIESALKREDSIEITAIDIEQENKALAKENKKLKRVSKIIKDILVFNFNDETKSMTITRKNGFMRITLLFDKQTEYDLLKEVLL